MRGSGTHFPCGARVEAGPSEPAQTTALRFSAVLQPPGPPAPAKVPLSALVFLGVLFSSFPRHRNFCNYKWSYHFLFYSHHRKDEKLCEAVLRDAKWEQSCFLQRLWKFFEHSLLFFFFFQKESLRPARLQSETLALKNNNIKKKQKKIP